MNDYNVYYEEIRKLAGMVKRLEKDVLLENIKDGIFSIDGDLDIVYFLPRGIKTIFDEYSLNGVMLEGKKKVCERNIFDIFFYVYKNLDTGEENYEFEIVFYEILNKVPKDEKFNPWVVTNHNSCVHGNFRNLEEAEKYAKKVLENI